MNTILRPALLSCLLILPTLSWAQEFVTVPRRLSDEAFYRLVACAAPPGGECRKPLIRWSDQRAVSLTVGVVQIDDHFPNYKLDLVEAAIDRAIAEINASGAYLVLERSYEPDPDIAIYLLDTPQGGIIEGTGNRELDGSELAVGRVAIRSLGADIQEAASARSPDIKRREIS